MACLAPWREPTLLRSSCLTPSPRRLKDASYPRHPRDPRIRFNSRSLRPSQIPVQPARQVLSCVSCVSWWRCRGLRFRVPNSKEDGRRIESNGRTYLCDLRYLRFKSDPFWPKPAQIAADFLGADTKPSDGLIRAIHAKHGFAGDSGKLVRVWLRAPAPRQARGPERSRTGERTADSRSTRWRSRPQRTLFPSRASPTVFDPAIPSLRCAAREVFLHNARPEDE